MSSRILKFTFEITNPKIIDYYKIKSLMHIFDYGSVTFKMIMKENIKTDGVKQTQLYQATKFENQDEIVKYLNKKMNDEYTEYTEYTQYKSY